MLQVESLKWSPKLQYVIDYGLSMKLRPSQRLALYGILDFQLKLAGGEVIDPQIWIKSERKNEAQQPYRVNNYTLSLGKEDK